MRTVGKRYAYDNVFLWFQVIEHHKIENKPNGQKTSQKN
jgi:hypothetical protein